MHFTQIKNLKQLVKFTNIFNGYKNNDETKTYSHYTTLENFYKIVNSNFFLLTHAISDTLNDQHENFIKGNQEVRKLCHIACFTNNQEQSIAMWVVYRKTNEPMVRIIIPKEVMKELIKQPILYFTDNEIRIEKKQKLDPNMIDEISLNDILYINGLANKPMESTIFLKNNKLSLFNKPEINHNNINYEKEITCLLKNIAWKYEEETRLIVKTKEKYYNKLAIELPRNFWENVTIQISPFCYDYLYNEIKKQIERKFLSINNNITLKFDESIFEGQIKLPIIDGYVPTTKEI